MDIKKISDKICTFLGKFIALLIALFLMAFISKITYNAIAYEFNLPTFSFWVHLGAIYVLRYILHP